MIGKDEYIINIGNKMIKNSLLNPIAEKIFWKSIKLDNDKFSNLIKIELIKNKNY